MIDLFIKLAPTIATIFFFTIFCYVIFTVFRKDNKKKFDKYAEIPFKDSDDKEPK